MKKLLLASFVIMTIIISPQAQSSAMSESDLKAEIMALDKLLEQFERRIQPALRDEYKNRRKVLVYLLKKVYNEDVCLATPDQQFAEAMLNGSKELFNQEDDKEARNAKRDAELAEHNRLYEEARLAIESQSPGFFERIKNRIQAACKG